MLTVREVTRADADGHAGHEGETVCSAHITSGCVAKSKPPAQNKPAVSVTVEGGYGLEGKVGVKGVELKGGGAVKGEVEVSSDGSTKISAKGEIGGNVGPLKAPGVEVEKVTKNEHGESEKLTITPTKPGVAAGKSEITGWKNEITLAISAYVGWGAGISVTIRPTEIINVMSTGATCGCDFNTNQHGIGAFQ